MNYNDWLQSVSASITNDALWQMKVYRMSLFTSDLAWHDSRKLVKDRSMVSVADQLYRAVGSIGANISAGYRRASGKDQARFYEHALGSAREARDWYFKSRHSLGTAVTSHRMDLIAQISRQLLTLIPSHRGQYIKEENSTYETTALSNLLQNIPMPD